jgi:hypothetical protein
MKRVRTDFEFLTLHYCSCLRGWIWCFFCTKLEVLCCLLLALQAYLSEYSEIQCLLSRIIFHELQFVPTFCSVFLSDTVPS